ncbi:hypothetical protein RF11_13084 [Thelohanellus kitauei]|uniref:Uncharacterized protein n=1 Tax=Thelohanellus kitauei TaxID=669202 RepID=A0A0C2MX25_THEKT|nr:hypothetical protein RF11_13084 [Thelohanellus kitauei]
MSDFIVLIILLRIKTEIKLLIEFNEVVAHLTIQNGSSYSQHELAGLESTAEYLVFLFEVPDRTDATLLGLIRTHILTHLTVNRWETLKDPETSDLTNYIEET